MFMGEKHTHMLIAGVPKEKPNSLYYVKCFLSNE